MTQVQSVPQEVRKVNLPEGAKLGFTEPISPVYITRIRTVGRDRQTIELQLEQLFPQPLGNQSGLLAITMQGHSAFNSGPRKRVCWQNYSTVKAIADGIITSWEQVGNAKVEIDGNVYEGWLVFEQPRQFVFKDNNGNILNSKIVEEDTFTPRKWDDNGVPREQRPKTAGNGGDLLIFTDSKGQQHKIYANRHLSVEGMDDPKTGKKWDEDLVIVHNNTIVGSSVRANMAMAGISVPTIPGSPAGVPGQDQFQNRRPGYTSNLLQPRREPTRSGPDEQQQQQAEKTKAEGAREAGERPVGAEPRS